MMYINGQAVAPTNLIKEGHNYSTDEQVVGTWIDGKPLYERTIVFETPVQINMESTICTLPWSNDIDLPIQCYGIRTSADTYGSLAVYVAANKNSPNDNGIYFYSNIQTKVKYIVIRYTKTTD